MTEKTVVTRVTRETQVTRDSMLNMVTGAAYTYMAYMRESPPRTLSAGPKGVPRLKES